nr:transposase, MuDR, MULE transposase domain protein [Tanacetum cinerariifolium]
MNESICKNEPDYTNPESSFAFKSNEEYVDEKNDYDNVVDENPHNKFHKWNNFMLFKPEIPDTPIYRSKLIISKQYSQQSKVKNGNIFDNKEALMLAVRLKALNDGFQFLVDRSGPGRCELKCYQFNQCDWKLRARLWNNTGTITRIKIDEKGVFEMLFIAIGASIRMFLSCLRPVVMIDAAHLKGLYNGTNLVAVAMDGNNQIVPIAFGICKGETGMLL